MIIKLNQSFSGGDIYIESAHIIAFESYASETKIELIGGISYSVSESPEEIKSIIVESAVEFNQLINDMMIKGMSEVSESHLKLLKGMKND